MFRSLDFNIEQYENDDYDDAWIDSGAQEVSIYCLNDFTEDDWKKFYEEVPKKSTGWKIRFVDCITDDHSGSEQLKALLYLTNTDDMELLTRIIDRLLCSDDLDLPKDIEDLGMSVVYDRVKKMLPVATGGYQELLNRFLETNK